MFLALFDLKTNKTDRLKISCRQMIGLLSKSVPLTLPGEKNDTKYTYYLVG